VGRMGKLSAHPERPAQADLPARRADDGARTAPYHLSRPRPGVLLDRDGTIIVDHGYVRAVEQVQLIRGSADAIARFNRAGVPVAVVSNQAGVARGYLTLEDVESVNARLSELLVDHGAHIDRYFFCPYHPDGVVPAFARPSEDRKPRPGMAIAAAAALNLDLRASWVIGDRPEDMGLAEQVGARAIYVGPQPSPAAIPASVRSFESLAQAASFVLEQVAA
jgi:histidinol-phosphate phosphatase family protein